MIFIDITVGSLLKKVKKHRDKLNNTSISGIEKEMAHFVSEWDLTASVDFSGFITIFPSGCTSSYKIFCLNPSGTTAFCLNEGSRLSDVIKDLSDQCVLDKICLLKNEIANMERQIENKRKKLEHIRLTRR